MPLLLYKFIIEIDLQLTLQYIHAFWDELDWNFLLFKLLL